MSGSDNAPLPTDTKLTRTKQKWAREGKFLTGRHARPDSERLPPGQHIVKDWPVLDLGIVPNITREHWRIDVTGAVEHPVSWDWMEFEAQPQTQEVSDIHCVTTWSRYDNQWQGLATRHLLGKVMPKDDAAFVILTSYDGYTTNLPLEDFAAEDALIAHSWHGEPVPGSTADRHGSSCRIFISGRARNGCRRWNSRHAITPGSGKSAAITIAAIHGPSSATRNRVQRIREAGMTEAVDRSSKSRRRFLQGVAGGVAAGALAGDAIAQTSKGTENVPPNIPEWMKTPGDPAGSQSYGTPSEYEKNVVRHVPKNAPQYISAASRTPLQDLDGIITPNGLFYERHHGGIPNIDPAQHRLVLHGLVDKPLIFTMEDIRRFPSQSRIHFIECSGNRSIPNHTARRPPILSGSSAAPSGPASA